MDKYIYCNGLKFTRDDKTGYYLNSTTMERLHRHIWKSHNGEIPKGFHVHHKDGDKGNNDISNLVLLKPRKHLSDHGVKRAIEDVEWLHRFHQAGIEAAKVWHGSADGKRWHRKHYEDMKYTLHQKADYTCEYCGTVFQTNKKSSNRFCSNNCKSAWRRKEGLDNEIRECPYCRQQFEANKYSKQRCCSKSCSNRLIPRLPQLRNG